MNTRAFSLVFGFLMGLLTMSLSACAEQQKITVSANSTEISDGLDLRAVANLFAKSKDLEKFEKTLNDPSESYTNLDLNGDGEVDYIRVIETRKNRQHIIVLQAVLAQDIFQDVATIIVDKDDEDQITMRVEGDVRIYGANYVIEPVFYVRPVIYDWFWGPGWYAWNSPIYWGYWPGWWYPYRPCPPVVYVERCCNCCRNSRSSFRCSSAARVSRTNDPVRSHGGGSLSRTPSSGRTAHGAHLDRGGTTISGHTQTAHGTTRPMAHTQTTPQVQSQRQSATGVARPQTASTETTAASARRPQTVTTTRQQSVTTASTRPQSVTTTTTSRPQSVTVTRQSQESSSSRPLSASGTVAQPSRNYTVNSTTTRSSSMSSGMSGGRSAGMSTGSMGGGAAARSSAGHSGAGRR